MPVAKVHRISAACNYHDVGFAGVYKRNGIVHASVSNFKGSEANAITLSLRVRRELNLNR